MDPVIYILDTNVTADRFNRLNDVGEAGHVVGRAIRSGMKSCAVCSKSMPGRNSASSTKRLCP